MKQVTPINVESIEPSTFVEQREEEDQILVVEFNTAILPTNKLCILSVVDGTMLMSILLEMKSEASSSTTITLSYDLGLDFLKETPLKMPHYFLIELTKPQYL